MVFDSLKNEGRFSRHSVHTVQNTRCTSPKFYFKLSEFYDIRPKIQ